MKKRRSIEFRRSTWAILTLVTFWTLHTFASFRTSFSLDYASWYATHIVLATEGDTIDGQFEVLESWKGDLKIGEKLSLPAFAEFALRDSRIVPASKWMRDTNRPVEFAGLIPITNAPPEKWTVVSGRRMVLFLCDQNIYEKAQTNSAPARQWFGACFNDMSVSAMWIENDQIYVRQQQMNPGPVQFEVTGMTEKDLRRYIQLRIEALEGLKKVGTLTGTDEAISILVHLLDSESPNVPREAANCLGEQGPKAWPPLQKALHDGVARGNFAHLLRPAARAGGREVGPDLVALLSAELEYFKSSKPEIASGAINVISAPPTKLQVSVDTVLTLIQILRSVDYPECVGVVKELRDFWREHYKPQPNGWRSKDFIVQECDLLLEKSQK